MYTIAHDYKNDFESRWIDYLNNPNSKHVLFLRNNVKTHIPVTRVDIVINLVD